MRRLVGAAVAAALWPLAGCAVLDSALNNAGNAMGRQVAQDSVRAATAPKKEDACAGIPDTRVSFEEERSLGQAVALKLGTLDRGLWIDARGKASVPKGPKAEVVRYLNAVGRNLAQQSSRPMLDWVFGVIDSDTVNAYSAPGGYVLVTTGLLKTIRTEDELAGVLGHEVGHVTGEHALKAYKLEKQKVCERAKFEAGLSSAVGAGVDAVNSTVNSEAARRLGAFSFGGGPGGVTFLNLNGKDAVKLLGPLTDATVSALVERGLSSEQEFEADQTAAQLVASAGYSPYAFAEYVTRVAGGGGNLLFPHHPPPNERRKKILEWIQTTETQAATGDGEFHEYTGNFPKEPKVEIGDHLQVLQLVSTAPAK